MKIVYLAGGMSTEWREKVKKALPNAIYLDPTTHGLVDEHAYTEWDIYAIKACDIVFAYLEEGNPSGYGLMLEIGVAWALGKEVIFVDEKLSMRKYTGMAHQLATSEPKDFDDGVRELFVSL